MITFVLYLVHLNAGELERIDRLKKFYKQISIDQCLELLVLSARLAHPDCRIVVLTDESTRIEQKDVEVFRYPVDRGKIAYFRFVAYQSFLREDNKTSHYVFLDCDMLIQKNLLEIFDGSFDIGLTYRTKRHPINGGLMFLADHAIRKGIKFFQSLINTMEMRQEKLRYWGGDQQALIDYFQLFAFIGRKSDIIEKKGITFKFFPAKTHNYTPDFSKGLKFYPDPYIIHFIDTRKERMPDYWEQFIQS